MYSWKLVATDKTPAGKRDVPALRDKEKEISRDLEDGIDTIGKKMTVCQLYAKQNGLRKNVKHGTKKGRDYLMGLLQDDPFGMKSIDAVKQSDAKEWVIRMSEKVYQALRRVLRNRGNAAPFSIEGYKNFLFLKNDGMPKVAANYESMLKGLVKKYNKQNKEQLPNITPHILRHTFCTRLANAGMNPKALQYIMGHANITMTLNYYAHATYDSAKAEMERLAA